MSSNGFHAKFESGNDGNVFLFFYNGIKRTMGTFFHHESTKLTNVRLVRVRPAQRRPMGNVVLDDELRSFCLSCHCLIATGSVFLLGVSPKFIQIK